MLLFIVSLLMLGCSAPSTLSVPVDPVAEKNMLQAVNRLREAGCTCGGQRMPPAPPLRWNENLAEAAKRHAADMHRHRFLRHRGSDRSLFDSRITEAGYAWSAVGENIARGHDSIESVMQAWIDSPDHCRTMMDPGYQDFGAARSGDFWVQNFATGY